MGVIILNVLKSPVEKISGEIFNAGATEHNHTKKEIVEMFQDILPELKVQYVADVDDKRNYRITCKKLEKSVGFKASRDVRSGIKELVLCFKNNILTKDDYESNNLEKLKSFYVEKENALKWTPS